MLKRNHLTAPQCPGCESQVRNIENPNHVTFQEKIDAILKQEQSDFRNAPPGFFDRFDPVSGSPLQRPRERHAEQQHAEAQEPPRAQSRVIPYEPVYKAEPKPRSHPPFSTPERKPPVPPPAPAPEDETSTSSSANLEFLLADLFPVSHEPATEEATSTGGSAEGKTTGETSQYAAVFSLAAELSVTIDECVAIRNCLLKPSIRTLISSGVDLASHHSKLASLQSDLQRIIATTCTAADSEFLGEVHEYAKALSNTIVKLSVISLRLKEKSEGKREYSSAEYQRDVEDYKTAESPSSPW